MSQLPDLLRTVAGQPKQSGSRFLVRVRGLMFAGLCMHPRGTCGTPSALQVLKDEAAGRLTCPTEASISSIIGP